MVLVIELTIDPMLKRIPIIKKVVIELFLVELMRNINFTLEHSLAFVRRNGSTLDCFVPIVGVRLEI